VARPAPIARSIEPFTRSAASAVRAGASRTAWTIVHVAPVHLASVQLAPVATFAALAWAAAAAHLARAIGPGTAAIIVTAHLARAFAAIIVAGPAT
jgi:hypothetical protein